MFVVLSQSMFIRSITKCYHDLLDVSVQMTNLIGSIRRIGRKGPVSFLMTNDTNFVDFLVFLINTVCYHDASLLVSIADLASSN